MPATIASDTDESSGALSMSQGTNPHSSASFPSSVLAISESSSAVRASDEDESVSKFVIPSSRVAIDTSEEGLLGAGSYGVVRRATYDQHPVVVKTLIIRTLSRRVALDFKREARVLSELNHPRVVRFYGVILEPGLSALVMEYLPFGSLFEIYTNAADPADIDAAIQMPPYASRLQLAVDIASGMHYLHNHKPAPVFHRDLKSMNVLCEKDLEGRIRAKLADFGLALNRQMERDFARGPKGTPLWMAPELNDAHAKFTAFCDVYSFGVLLTEIGSWAGP
ncbi:kinase-like domain-containing protein, partial [Zopfochytrium polystomum]